MRVVIPYTARHLETIAGAPENAEWFDVSVDNEAYWRLLGELWLGEDDLLIVEHDIVCRPDVIEGMLTCPKPWCAHGYDNMCHPECMEAWRNALGCTRFRREVMVAVPDAISAIPPGRFRDWHQLCDGVGNRLRAEGFTHHWHEPAVHHHCMRLPPETL
jgi:hypothetical protein